LYLFAGARFNQGL